MKKRMIVFALIVFGADLLNSMNDVAVEKIKLTV